MEMIEFFMRSNCASCRYRDPHVEYMDGGWCFFSGEYPRPVTKGGFCAVNPGGGRGENYGEEDD